MFEFCVVIDVYFMSTVSNEFLCQRFYIFTNENSANFVANGVGQDTGLTQQFKRYIT